LGQGERGEGGNVPIRPKKKGRIVVELKIWGKKTKKSYDWGRKSENIPRNCSSIQKKRKGNARKGTVGEEREKAKPPKRKRRKLSTETKKSEYKPERVPHFP